MHGNLQLNNGGNRVRTLRADYRNKQEGQTMKLAIDRHWEKIMSRDDQGRIHLTPKILSHRKLGHLWQVLYGLPGRNVYGYGATRRQASEKARGQWKAKV